MSHFLLKEEESHFYIPHELLSVDYVLLYSSDSIADARERFFKTYSLKMLFKDISPSTFWGNE